MPSSRPCGIAFLGLALAFSGACGKSPGVPGNPSANAASSLAAPFNHQLPSGSNPSSEPPTATPDSLPEGTPITARLLAPISSASSHAGDTFEGILDDPIVIEDQTAAPRGSAVTGRILAAKASGAPSDPGYLRIALVGITVDGKRVSVETSSLFVKGKALTKPDRAGSSGSAPMSSRKSDVSFGSDRALVFRIAQPIEIP